MELFEFMQLLNIAITKENEEKLWQQWKVDYSRMDKETFISFEDYKLKAFKPKVNIEVDVKEIIRNAEMIKNADQKRKSTI